MRPEAKADLWDARGAAAAIGQFIDGLDEAGYMSSALTRSAVERQLEILGGALNRLRRHDAVTADRVPDLHRIVGMRNVLAHEYGSVDDALVWSAATGRVPEPFRVLAALLEEEQS